MKKKPLSLLLPIVALHFALYGKAENDSQKMRQRENPFDFFPQDDWRRSLVAVKGGDRGIFGTPPPLTMLALLLILAVAASRAEESGWVWRRSNRQQQVN